MKKMVRLSLVAAVAVAGFGTSASAKSLTDAIQNVDVSGLVRYRIGNKKTETATTTKSTTEHVKIVLGLKSKVNDNITAAVKAVMADTADNGDTAGKDNTATFNVAKFTYANNGNTATVGTMELATPWTDAANGARANGLLATTNLGSVTLAGAYFRDSQMGTDKSADVNGNANSANLNSNILTALAAIGSAGGVSYQAWYLNIADPKDEDGTTSTLGDKGGDATALLLNSKFGPVSVNASYASLDPDVTGVKKQTLTKVIASGKVNNVTLVAGMADGGKDGDLVTFDPDAKVGFQSWNIRAGQGKQCDLSAYTVAAVVPAGAVSVKLQYTDAEFDDAATATKETDVDEKLIQISYKMSKNFNTYIRYADVDQDVKTVATGTTANTNIKRTRIELAYKF
jgi:hypothetical protein